MWLVDSSVWIDYFGGKVTLQTDLLHAALGSEAIAVGDIILCEVLQGYRRQEDFDAARQALLRFPVFPIGGSGIAIKAAE
ncbi:MAG: PIN domain-containing protein, partial [Anaerolineae bacterium]